jgi:hypothetical protein
VDADDVGALSVPGERLGALALVREVEERREQLSRLDGAPGDELGDREDPGRRRLSGVALQIQVSEGGVGGTQVDADDVTRGAQGKTSGKP